MKRTKPSIKHITLRKVIAFAALILLFLVLWIGYAFKGLVIDAMKDKGTTLARVVETSLASHMQAFALEQKDVYLNKLQMVVGLSDLHLVHSDAVSRQFALPSHEEQRREPVIAAAFASGQPQFVTPTLSNGPPILTVAYPYRAGSDTGIVCRNCHDVPEGAVLGVIAFKVDMSSYLGTSLHFLYLSLGAFLIFLPLIVLVLFRMIDRHINRPLRDLIRNTKDAYASHIPIDLDRYESQELDYVAEKVNEFTMDILAKQTELQEKHLQLIMLNKEIEGTQREIIQTLGEVAESRSKETAAHVRRVADYSLLLARLSGLPDQECQMLYDAAAMHDIGKVGVPDSILNKPAQLTDSEYKEMTRHSQLGYDIFKGSQRPLLKTAAIIAQQHHEHWDGNGYPLGLAGEEIHPYGRIVAVADVFDALTSKRCYKAPWSQDKVFAFFASKSGSQFEPRLVEILLAHRDEMLEIHRRYDGTAPEHCAG